MIFFTEFIYAFLPLAILYGLLRNIKEFDKEQIKINTIIVLSFLSIILGMFIQKVAIVYLYENEVVFLIQLFTLIAWLFFVFLAFIRRFKILFYLVFIATSLDSGASFIYGVKDFSLSTTSIINTDLIINISFILLGIFLTGFLAIASEVLIKKSNHKVYYFTFIITIFMYLVQKIASLMLYGFKKDILELTSLKLSFVAKTTYYEFLTIYIYLSIIAFFILLYYLNTKSEKMQENLGKSELRKWNFSKIINKRWRNYSIIAVSLISINLAYYDLYASQPPKISNPIMIKPNENDQFVIEIKDVIDGDLHRYGYITEDGHKVRFFLINKYPNREKVTVVFDACMICGDEGYIKKDNQVICISCGVRIFIPSIGKPGGCNPIPLKFTKKNGKVYIDKTEIISGAKYFSEIVEIEVKDPLTGAKMINKKAPFSYKYLGKTFYFENEKNLKIFRENPEKYTKSAIKRELHIQNNSMKKGE